MSHPKDRPIEPADPMLLSAEQIDGNPGVMLESLIEEFARMGMPADQIQKLFQERSYQATYSLTERFGEEEVRRRINQTLERCGVYRYTETAPPRGERFDV